MAEGLRPHHHQYFEYHIKTWYSNEQHCVKKKITYMCMICGKLKKETYDCDTPPSKHKGIKTLEKQKRKRGDVI